MTDKVGDKPAAPFPVDDALPKKKAEGSNRAEPKGKEVVRDEMEEGRDQVGKLPAIPDPGKALQAPERVANLERKYSTAYPSSIANSGSDDHPWQLEIGGAADALSYTDEKKLGLKLIVFSSVAATVQTPELLKSKFPVKSCPEKINLLAIGDEAFTKNLDREQQRGLMNLLHKPEERSSVEVVDRRVEKRHIVNKYDKQVHLQLDKAGLLALGFAARGKTEAFIQAFGAAPSGVSADLLPLIYPPTVGCQHIGDIAHLAVRSLAPRMHHLSDTEPKIQVASAAIAQALSELDKGKPRECAEKFMEFYERYQTRMIARSKERSVNARDVGLEIGTLVAGVLQYLQARRVVIQKRLDWAALFVAVAIGALGQAPKVDKAVEAAKPLIDELQKRIGKKLLGRYDVARDTIVETLTKKIDTPIFMARNEFWPVAVYGDDGKKADLEIKLIDGGMVTKYINKALSASHELTESRLQSLGKLSSAGT